VVVRRECCPRRWLLRSSLDDFVQRPPQRARRRRRSADAHDEIRPSIAEAKVARELRLAKLNGAKCALRRLRSSSIFSRSGRRRASPASRSAGSLARRLSWASELWLSPVLAMIAIDLGAVLSQIYAGHW
jgi:hypothetical protein